MPKKFKIGDIVHYTHDAPLCPEFLARHPRGPYRVIDTSVRYFPGCIQIEYLEGGTRMRQDWTAHRTKHLRLDEFLMAVKRATHGRRRKTTTG